MNPDHPLDPDKSPAAASPNLVGSGFSGRTPLLDAVELDDPATIRLAEEREAFYCKYASRRRQDAEAELAEHEAARARHEAERARHVSEKAKSEAIAEEHRSVSEPERLRMKSLREKVSIVVLALVAVAGATFALAGFLIHPLLFPAAVALLSAIVKPASQAWVHSDSRPK